MTIITDSVPVKNGTDFTFVCGKIPFAISCSSTLQHGAYNLIDLDLVNKMRIPLQKIKVCRMTYFGENLRSVGYIDQTIQCVHNGVIKGTIHLAAKVIRNLYDNFNVDCIASSKTYEKLTGNKPPDPPDSDHDAEDDQKDKAKDVKLENGDDKHSFSSASSSTCSDAIPAISKAWIWQASFMAEVAQKDSADALLKLEDEKALNRDEEEESNDTTDTDTKTEANEEENSDEEDEKHCNLCFRFGQPIQITTNHDQNCPTCPTMSEKLKLALIGSNWKEKAEKIIRSRHEKQLRRGRRL